MVNTSVVVPSGPHNDDRGTPDTGLGNEMATDDCPPSFSQSQFDIVLRRQRIRPPDGGLKISDLPSRILNLPNQFEFAGWGSVTRLKLEEQDHVKGEEALKAVRNDKVMGQFMASALAGNDILGGVFYTIPATFAVASVYSPISLFVATLTLFLWRPVMEELGSALPISGTPYAYLLNVSSKNLALVGAVLLILDFAATAAVSAATAVAYLAGEVSLPFSAVVGFILVLVLFTAVSLSGVKESSRFALAVLTFHLVTIFVLVIASVVEWGRVGNIQLKENWNMGRASSTKAVAHQLFNGFCIAMLGLTGFECAPVIMARTKPGRYPLVLRNLHYSAIAVNFSTIFLVLTLLPLEPILQGANVLSVLAEVVAGRWLRIWVVVDAVTVLCSGVLTGIVSASELLEQLTRDRVLPKLVLTRMPFTRSPFIAILCFSGFAAVLFLSAGTRLSIISEMFTLVWLSIMVLFPLSLLLLKYNRGRLPRQPQTSLLVIFGALGVSATVFAGNVSINPRMAGYFLAYFLGILILFWITQHKTHLLRWVYWAYDQNPSAHDWHMFMTWSERFNKVMTRLRRQPVCILAKTDEIGHLHKMISYVRQNEETSCVKIAHFYDEEKGIPSEMEANAKILDEQFPEITIDLTLIQGQFTPSNVAALSHRLQIPCGLIFMSCPGSHFPHSIAEFGTRIISL